MARTKKQKTDLEKASSFIEGKNLTDKDFVNMLRNYVATQRISWTQLAHQLGVTQNTLTNWNKGCPISVRNKRNILALMENPSTPPVIIDYKSRLEDPISAAMRKIWGSLSELDKARIYMIALECRDGIKPGSLYKPSKVDPEQKAAEPKRTYKRKKAAK